MNITCHQAYHCSVHEYMVAGTFIKFSNAAIVRDPGVQPAYDMFSASQKKNLVAKLVWWLTEFRNWQILGLCT